MLNKLENFTKLKKHKGSSRNGDAISIWAILFSTIFYVLIFFFFNISISAIINTTIFWFLISNTLILILAADFGAFFSSTNNEQELYEDYVKKTHARNVPSFENNYMKITNKLNTQIETADDRTADDRTEEHIKDVVVVEKVSKDVRLEMINKCESTKKPILEKNVEEIQEEKKAVKFESMKKPSLEKNVEEIQEKKAAKFDRAYSAKGGVVVGEEEREIVFRRSKSERHSPEGGETDFSTMSIEELNRRAEEFIQRFNQEIRLQAAKNRQHSQK